ncbi:glucans biosynthesis glucosyltransferase MdoH [Bradyrhizobium sp. SYSU BS000235]|uniref:glucans biosynthesis glucosyltransferase MdoH n=1 Tax=Bradyrhizobium sp. SYSU BS000235 TaxID=3411332 RepID=UPI003C75CBFF
MAQTEADQRIIFARRAIFAVLCLGTMAWTLWLAILTLRPGGFGPLDLVALSLFAIILPWMVVGFWNAVIGFIILRFSPDPVAAVLPVAGSVRGNERITASTAILMCTRNEHPARIIRNLEPMLEGLHASGFADRFHLYVLSDTNDPEFAIGEEARFSELIATWRDRIAMTYRRRTVNTGFKAGNIRDFCERWGDHHELAVTLDADSFMPSDAILRLVRIMQLDPRIGILQGLIVGLPSTSLFARIFQFGMRLGMRSYTIGSAWWQSDCGPYWGHNAVLRLEPFIKHCQLPLLSDAGEEEQHILSHDQIEAVLMRAAGYHVRVVPQDDLGWEENPPTLLEFMRRDVRWCQGNMQYWRFVSQPGLKPVSRYQLVLAILMFIGSPAWVGLLALTTAALVLCDSPSTVIEPDAGKALLLWLLVMWFSPKIARALDILFSPRECRSFGGASRFVINLAIETIFSILLSPILWISHTIFLTGLLFNREIHWLGQVRDDHAVPFREALLRLWPQTIIGCGSLGLVAMSQPSALPYMLLLAAGPAVAVPLAVITSLPALGELAARIGVGRLPEETATPEDLLELALPAIKSANPAPLPTSV